MWQQADKRSKELEEEVVVFRNICVNGRAHC